MTAPLHTIAMAIDEDVLARQAVTDPAAFGALYDHFFTRVYNYARYRCDEDATADDLAAQIFERAFTRLDQYAPERGGFAPWLFAIARNVVNDHWRRALRSRWLSLDFAREIPSPEPGPEAGVMGCEEEERLLAALAGLPRRARDILALKFAARLTNREIARALGLGESHVGVIIHRAIGKLREEMEE